MAKIFPALAINKTNYTKDINSLLTKKPQQSRKESLMIRISQLTMEYVRLLPFFAHEYNLG